MLLFLHKFGLYRHTQESGNGVWALEFEDVGTNIKIWLELVLFGSPRVINISFLYEQTAPWWNRRRELFYMSTLGESARE